MTNPSEQWGRRSRRCISSHFIDNILENVVSEKTCRREKAFSESPYSEGVGVWKTDLQNSNPLYVRSTWFV